MSSGLRATNRRLVALDPDMVVIITAPMARGATSASQGNDRGSGADGASGSSTLNSTGRAKTRGERTNATSVDAAAADAAICVTATFVPPMSMTSPGPN